MISEGESGTACGAGGAWLANPNLEQVGFSGRRDEGTARDSSHRMSAGRGPGSGESLAVAGYAPPDEFDAE